MKVKNPPTLKAKSCPVCGTVFKPKKVNHKYCCTPCKRRARYLPGGNQTTDRQYETINGNWSRYYSRLCAGKRKGTLTVQDLIAQHEKQKGLCALSGQPLTCILIKGYRVPTNSSVDRIEAGGEYEPGNIQLVCNAVNSFRLDKEINDFVWWCERVSNHAKKEKKLQARVQDAESAG